MTVAHNIFHNSSYANGYHETTMRVVRQFGSGTLPHIQRRASLSVLEMSEVQPSFLFLSEESPIS